MVKKLIIFDCYGTLLTKPKGEAYKKLFNTIGLKMKNHYKSIITKKDNDWSVFVDFDKITKETYDTAIRDFEIDIENENSDIKPYLENMQEYLTVLREQYTVVILSNLSDGYAKPITDHLASYVDKVFYSYDIEEMKPNPNSFLIVKKWFVENFGEIDHRHILVIDDSAKNIQSANSINMLGINVNNGNLNSPQSIKSFFEWTLHMEISWFH